MHLVEERDDEDRETEDEGQGVVESPEEGIAVEAVVKHREGRAEDQNRNARQVEFVQKLMDRVRNGVKPMVNGGCQQTEDRRRQIHKKRSDRQIIREV